MRTISRAGLVTAALFAVVTASAAAAPAGGRGCGAGFGTCASTSISFEASGGFRVATPVMSLIQRFDWHPAADRQGLGAGVGGPGGNTVVEPPPTVTPEPVSMTLLATGLVGVGLARRRRRSSPPA